MKNFYSKESFRLLISFTIKGGNNELLELFQAFNENGDKVLSKEEIYEGIKISWALRKLKRL
jgi:hypothetical protein